MTTSPAEGYTGALEAIDRILNRGGDPYGVLLAVVTVIHERAGFDWAAVTFGEREVQAGRRSHAAASFPVVFRGQRVAELRVAPEPPEAPAHSFLERVALLVSAVCWGAAS